MHARLQAARLAAALLLVAGCSGGNADTHETDDTDPAELQWYLTCGDPVCQGYTGPFEGVELCDAEAIGDPCADRDVTCDPQNDCNALLICADSDPTQQTGGCPISRRVHKTGVRYLSASEVDALGRSVTELPLATWRYTWQEEGSQLGFLIDDAPTSPAVRADGGHVDLYGYTSLTVAALQSQAREIEALRAELAAMRQQLDALQRDGGTCAE